MPPGVDFDRCRVLTFDCYGTLVDWETGILDALRPLLDRHRIRLPDQRVLQLYADLETRAEHGAYRPYREVLASVVQRLGQTLGFHTGPLDWSRLEASLGRWPPFPDTVAALRALQQRYRIAVVSNTDDALFAITAPSLEIPFDHVITAEQVGAYKPSVAMFEAALDRIGEPRDRVIHVAQSLFHDIAPASALGLANVWIKRRAGFGATPEAHVQPDLELPDLRALVDACGLG